MSIRALVAGLFCTLGAAPAEDKKPEKKSEPCVVFDFSNWSVRSDTSHVTLKLDYDGAVGGPYRLEGEGGGVNATEFSQIYYENLKRSGVKVEWIDKIQVRVYGWTDENGVFHPALKGRVISEKLKPEQLPTVTDPGKKG